MKLNKLSVQNWRGIKNANLEFGNGVTIIGGPNESGKTSLRNALRSALLLPTGLRGEVKSLEANRPWETRLCPKVMLELVIEDKICVVKKEFLRKKSWAELLVNGTLKAEDDEVQPKLLELLGETAGWIDTLWGEQGDVKLDRAAPESIKGRLAAAAQDTVMPAVTQLHDLINEEFEEFWTKGRKPNKRVQTMRDATMQAEREVESIKLEIKRADERSEEVSEKRKQLEKLLATQSKLEQDWQRGQESLAVWETYALAKSRTDQEEQEAKRIEQWLNIWKQHLSEARALLPACQTWQKQIDELKEQLEKIPSRAEVDALTARQEYLKQSLANEKYQAALAIEVPEAAELQKMRHSEDNLRNIDAKLKMGELRANLTAEAALQVTVLRDASTPELIELKATDSQTWTAEQGFELHLPGVARLKVESGNPSIVEDIAQRSQLQKELNLALQAWSAENVAQLTARSKEREIRLQQTQKVDAKQLAAARAQILDADVLDLLPQEERESKLASLPAQILAVENTWKEAQEQHQKAVTKQQALNQSNPVAKMDATIKALQTHCLSSPFAEKDKLEVPQVLSNDWLEKSQVHDRSWQQHWEQKKSHAVELKEKAIRPEGDEVTKESLKQMQDQKDSASPKIQELSATVNQMIGNIEAQGDLYARLVTAQEAQAKCEADEKRVFMDASSIHLLMEAFEAVRDQLQKDVVAPLENHVSTYFSTLTAGFYNGVKFDPSLKLNGVATATVNAVSLDDVSFGTREQLSLLMRLCLAELLAKDNAGQVVILDDNLVHTDDKRMELACNLLENASGKVQIIVFTCHPERYAHIKGATQVTVAS